jgi:hypothetical protein
MWFGKRHGVFGVSGWRFNRDEVRLEHNFREIQLADLVSVWSHAYHVTCEENLTSIRSSRILRPTVTLLQRTGEVRLIRERRMKELRVLLEGQPIVIRNQLPLDPASMDLGQRSRSTSMWHV